MFVVIAADSDNIRHYAARYGIFTAITRVRCDGELYTVVPAADVSALVDAVDADMSRSDKAMMDEIADGTVWPDSFSTIDIQGELRRTVDRCRSGAKSDRCALLSPVATVQTADKRTVRAAIRA